MSEQVQDYGGRRRYRRPSPRRRARRRRALLILIIIILAAAALIWRPWEGRGRGNTGVTPPEWVEQELLPLNRYSRPGTALKQVNGVVVHYVGNPGTTAAQNRGYFAKLALTGETYASSHFIVDLDGAVIQCVPLDEIAYCSNQANGDTISIECCHPDETGEFTRETLDGLTRLTNWLIAEYRLDRSDILRHYDITGKECPRWFVVNPEAWEAFLDGLTFP